MTFHSIPAVKVAWELTACRCAKEDDTNALIHVCTMIQGSNIYDLNVLQCVVNWLIIFWGDSQLIVIVM